MKLCYVHHLVFSKSYLTFQSTSDSARFYKSSVICSVRMARSFVYESLDSTQRKLMDERCILVDKRDEIIGSESKRNCHLKSNIKQKRMLHRAFSVFLFSQDASKMFLQQRAPSKITYPNLWSNACCSHPLFEIESEIEGWSGVKKAAIRRMNFELGSDTGCFREEDFIPMGRIHYEAENSIETEPEFMEHEIDYLLFVQKDLQFDHVNKNEVNDSKWVSEEELRRWLKEEKNDFTPWFRLIAERKLFDIWNQFRSGCVQELEETKSSEIERWVTN